MTKNRADTVLNLIKHYVTNKSVLDVGCLGSKKDIIIHNTIVELSSKYLGVDVNKKVLQLKGNVLHKDFLTLNIDDKFDVVFAGDIIEHIAEHKKFLSIVYQHLKNNGWFIITTPNPYFLGRFLEILIKDDVYVNPNHYCYFCAKTISKLLKDNKFTVKKVCWFTYNISHYTIGYIFLKLRNYFKPAFMVVAQKK